MVVLKNYIITETLDESASMVVYRGVRRHDGAAVIIKTLRSDSPAPQDIEHLRREYEIEGRLDSPYVVTPYEFDTNGSPPLLLVFADFGGQPLARLLGNPFETGRFLEIALHLAAALADIHRQDIIHKDITPANILIDPHSGRLKLTGFGIAAPLARFPGSEPGSTSIEGSLPYMSPEQTGRMNRGIDHRSDLYSLGVTFYEMLTGGLPFHAADPPEWVHCHIARQPKPPSDSMPAIPEPVAAIVMKLLAKQPEERYQTALGLRSDLRKCLKEREAKGLIEAFPLGKEDIPDRLLIPQKLYGREQDIDTLLAAFDRVVETGTPELIMVAGYSGIGKTALIRELQQPIARKRGFFVSGKFDRIKHAIPHSTVAETFEELGGQILAGSEENVAEWQRRIQDTLGANGRIMVELIPQLELIIGKQPPVADLPPAEAQNRFNMVFRQLIGVFAKKEHPLVVFLDDLQWIDSATLKLLEHVMTHPDTRHLLFIGAYRDNEVGAAHPLISVMDTLRKSEAIIQTITLASLTFIDLSHFMADTFRAAQARVEPLTRLVYEKTGGNPFFVIQFLNTLHDEGLVAFDPTEQLWKWDMVRIRDKGYTDNVVDLMREKLKKLSDRTLQAIQFSACIGSRFDLHTLAAISSLSEEETRESLGEALQEGVVLGLTGTAYKFLHDRVQEAAYLLVAEGERPAVHLGIGRLLLGRTPPEELEEKIFEIVNQLDRGAALISRREERERLAELNLVAAARAMASTAYASALQFLDKGRELLVEDSWDRRYDLIFGLELHRAECAFLVGHFQLAETLFSLLLEKARSAIDLAKVHRLRIRLYHIAGRLDDAVKAVRDALRLLGVSLPDSDEAIRAGTEAKVREVAVNLRDRRIANLVDAPHAADPTIRMIISLIAESIPATYIARPRDFALLTAIGVNVSLRHGHTAESSDIYSAYAMLLVSILGDLPSGFEFSAMALNLLEKFDHPRSRGAVLLRHGYFINHWRRHVATSLPYLEQSFLASREMGDFVHAGYAVLMRGIAGLEKGEPLVEVLELFRQAAAFCRESHNEQIYQLVRLWRQFVICLQGLTRGPTSLENDDFDEAGALAYFRQVGHGSALTYYHIMKQVTAFTHGQYAAALASAAQAGPALRYVSGMVLEASHHFYHALTLTALYPEASIAQQQEFRRILDSELRRFKGWADNCPQNYLNRYALVAAEIARIDGRELEAERRYEEAIGSARDNGFVQYEALGNELAARFHLGRGFETIARAYLRQARSCYARWGADGKVKQLDEAYPWLGEEERAAAARIHQVDTITMVKCSQAISGEIHLANLLDTLMRIVMENAGAQTGCLILAHGDELSVAARARVEAEEIRVLREVSAPLSAVLPLAIINYVRRTRHNVILADASGRHMFSPDDYIQQNRPISVLCLPVLRQAHLIGLLYLENNLVKGAFTADRITVLEALAAQAAISLENARLYDGLQQEIAERMRAEEAVSTSRHQLQSIIDNSTAVIYVKDPEGRYLLINKRFEDLFHVTKESVVGKTDYDIFPKERADAFRTFDRHVFFTRTIQQSEEIVPHDDGLHAYITSKAPLYDEAGKPYAVCGISTDITERKQAEEELRQHREHLEDLVATRTAELAAAKTKAEEADRLKSSFLATMSHELRTPLNSIIGFSSIMLQGLAGPLNPEQSLQQNIVKRSALHLLDLINDILDLSKIEAGQIEMRPEHFDMRALIEKTLLTLTPMAERKNLELVADLAPEVQRIFSDPRRVEQILINLGNNAIKFTEQGQVRIECRTCDGMLLTSVKDTGIGIKPEDIGKLFTTFRQLDSALDRRHEGTGLGLSICRKLAALLGGEIRVQSTWGAGSTFTLVLPLNREGERDEEVDSDYRG